MVKKAQKQIAQRAIEISTSTDANKQEKSSQKCYRFAEKETVSADNCDNLDCKLRSAPTDNCDSLEFKLRREYEEYKDRMYLLVVNTCKEGEEEAFIMKEIANQKK